MLAHVCGPFCWCRPEVEEYAEGRLFLHRDLDLEPDPEPRAAGLLIDGPPV